MTEMGNVNKYVGFINAIFVYPEFLDRKVDEMNSRNVIFEIICASIVCSSLRNARASDVLCE